MDSPTAVSPPRAAGASDSGQAEPGVYKPVGAPTPILAALVIALLLSALDNTIVGTALATIAGKLGGIESFAWVTTAYIACSTIATLLLGKLSDLYGRRNLLLFSIGVFIVASVPSPRFMHPEHFTKQIAAHQYKLKT